MQKVVIIGGGNVGVAAAVDISQNVQFKVVLFSSHANKIVGELCKINTDTEERIFAKNVLVTSDCKLALVSADIVIVTVPSFVAGKVVSLLSQYNPMMVIFVPGYGGKELYCDKLRKRGCIIAGLDRSPYVARLENYVTVRASSKKYIRVGCMRCEELNKIVPLVETLFKIPCTAVNNYLTVAFTPSNPILHTARLYSLFHTMDFSTKINRLIKFYAEWDELASDLLLKMDVELLHICSLFPKIDLSGVIPNSVHYGIKTTEELTAKMRGIESLREIIAPLREQNGELYIDSESRYFKEDFMFGLCNLRGYAEIAGANTPHIDHVLHWYENISGERFFDCDGKYAGDCLAKTGVPQNFGFNTVSAIEQFYME